MIARRWHGRVPLAKAERYRRFLAERAVPDYRATPGNIAAFVLERAEEDSVHFETLTFWSDEASIRAFAGDPIDTAKYYREDRDFLLEFEPKVVHHAVVARG